MSFREWLTEMERIAAPVMKQVKSPTGARKPTMKLPTPSHLGARPNSPHLNGFAIPGQKNYVKKPPKSIQRPSDK